ARRSVELREAQALARQPVEVGRLDLAAVAAEVGVAHVVVQDQHDVRLLACHSTHLCHLTSVVPPDAQSRCPPSGSKRCAAPGAKLTQTSCPSSTSGTRSAFSFTSW